MKKRSIARLVVAGLAGLALVAPMSGPAAAGSKSLPNRIELPVGFQPEGITIGKAPYAYVGSLADGDIYRADLRTGRGQGDQRRTGNALGRAEARQVGPAVRGGRAVGHRPGGQHPDRHSAATS